MREDEIFFLIQSLEIIGANMARCHPFVNALPPHNSPPLLIIRALCCRIEEMKLGLKLKPLDFGAFFIGAALLALFTVTAFEERQNAGNVHITIRGEESIYPITEDRVLHIEGPLGTTHIEIKEGSVRITDSPCADKLCIQMGAISKSGQWIACLPNQLFIRIRGKEDEAIDARSY